MRNATIVVIALAAIAGCKKSDKPAQTTTTTASGSAPAPTPAPVRSGSGSAPAVGSGSGSAAPAPVKGACFTSKDATIDSFTIDDKTATVCAKLAGDTPVHMCIALDIASGKWSAATAPAKSAEATISPAKLHLPKPPEGSTYVITPSADGAQLITTIRQGKSSIEIFDAKTDKRTKKIPFGDDQAGNCLENAYFVGDNIFTITSVCAGPGGTGNFLTKDGTVISKMDSTHNVYGATPVKLDGDLWALAEFGGSGIDIVDGKAGKEIAHYDVPDQAECTGCMEASSDFFALDPLKKLPSGKLALISGAGISIVDPKALAPVAPVRMPVCVAP